MVSDGLVMVDYGRRQAPISALGTKRTGVGPAYETLGGELPQRKKRERRPDGLMGRRQRPD